MNSELKALIAVAFDCIALGKSVLGKQYLALFSEVSQLVLDAPSAISNLSDLQAEIAALAGSAQEADLVAFIKSKVSGVTDDAKAQKILAIALDLVQHVVQDVIALESALKA